MPKKKQCKPNAFMCFVQEWREEQPRQMRAEQAVARCGPIWENMSAAERAPYGEMARSEKRMIVQKPQEKLNTQGVPITLADKERIEAEDRERQMKRDIESIVRQTVDDETLAEQLYYFCMVNYFVKSIRGEYIPAEIALIEFSLKTGVKRKYHTYVNPGNTIFGFSYEAQAHSDSTHKLPLPPTARGQTDLPFVYNEVLQFINGNKPYNVEHGGKLPPIFTTEDAMPILESVLEFLLMDWQKPAALRIYSIEYLYYMLKVACAEAGELTVPKSRYITDSYFQKDLFEYEPGIACEYHEEVDRTKFCALSMVVRWGYMFAEYMGNDLALELKPGFHLPQRLKFAVAENAANTETKRERIQDAKSVVSSNVVSTMTSYRTAPIGDAATFTTNGSSISDFPALGTKPKRSATAAASTLQPNLNFDEMEYHNPWNVRRSDKPNKPSTDSFIMNNGQLNMNLTLGRGRGFVRHAEQQQQAFDRGNSAIFNHCASRGGSRAGNRNQH